MKVNQRPLPKDAEEPTIELVTKGQSEVSAAPCAPDYICEPDCGPGCSPEETHRGCTPEDRD